MYKVFLFNLSSLLYFKTIFVTTKFPYWSISNFILDLMSFDIVHSLFVLFDLFSLFMVKVRIALH